MADLLFYLFAVLTLSCGLMVLFSRNPVTSAMFLVLMIVSMAGLFVLLHAFFLAAVQILVYAGAVMVLFLFVIMLLDLKEEQGRKINIFGAATGAISVLGILGIIMKLIWTSNPTENLPVPELEGATVPLGNALFHQFALPFEILSLLLLAAMVGVILLSKKDLK